MPSAYTDVTFTNAPLNGITAVKLNLLRDDLSAAIAAGGGGGTGTGDMTKAVYDTDNNGKVDTCDSLPWSAISGKPATFPPDPHQASHVTGTDQIPSASTSTKGLMPQANTNPNSFYASDGTQKQVSYTMLSGSQPGPVTHAASHVTGGGDIIPVATTSAVGLAPVRSGTATTYLNGAGAYTTPSGTTPSAHAPTHKSGGTDAIKLDELAAPTDITTLNASTSAHGLVPKLSGTATTFLNGTGAFTTPAGSGAAGYSTTATASFTIPAAGSTVTVAITSVTWGKVGQNLLISDGTSFVFCELTTRSSNTSWIVTCRAYQGNTVSGTMASGANVILMSVGQATATAAGLVPLPPNNTTMFLRGDATFATPSGIVPSAHASTHVTGGSDIIALASASTAGLLKLLSGNTTDFVDGTNACQSLASAIATIFGAWTAFTPVLVPGAGVITTQSGNGFYFRIGKTLFFNLQVTAPNVGSASGTTQISGFPIAPKNLNVFYFREVNLYGYGCSLTIGSTSGSLTTAANANPTWTNNASYVGFGVYEIA